MDYLRTGPRTTLTDPSTDHPPNKIKKTKVKISLTAGPIDHSCQRNFARYAGLRWVKVTDLGSVSSASYVIADHYIFAIFGAVALHERLGSLRDLCFLSLRHFVFLIYQYKFLAANCEDWDEFTNPRENRPNKMAKEMHFSRLPRDFPVFHIYV